MRAFASFVEPHFVWLRCKSSVFRSLNSSDRVCLYLHSTSWEHCNVGKIFEYLDAVAVKHRTLSYNSIAPKREPGSSGASANKTSFSEVAVARALLWGPNFRTIKSSRSSSRILCFFS